MRAITSFGDGGDVLVMRESAKRERQHGPNAQRLQPEQEITNQ
jgi:hypothetical protein